MRVAATVFVLLFAADTGCGPTGAFVCSEDSSCSGGMCQPTGYCSFADEGCASGQRYGAHAPADLAHVCVAEAGTEGVAETTSAETTSTATTSTATTSTTTTSTTDVSDTSTGPAVSASTTDVSSGSSTDTGDIQPCATEEFEDDILDGWSLWTSKLVAASVEDGALSFALSTEPSGGGLDPAEIGVADGWFEVELREVPTQVAGTQFFIGIGGGDDESYLLLLEQDTLYVRYAQLDSFENMFPVPWEPDDRFMRIEIENGVLGFSRSSDGETYLPVGSVEPGFALDTAAMLVHTGTWQDTQDPGFAVIERISVCPLP